MLWYLLQNNYKCEDGWNPLMCIIITTHYCVVCLAVIVCPFAQVILAFVFVQIPLGQFLNELELFECRKDYKINFQS